ncbi:MAG TPA: helix-turn-helix transcriptional regulator [Pseudonocardiaceae bacterium]|nr:helix-turn-helix transcriptional regulator [Pseudonocardiaceae bacterium]
MGTGDRPVDDGAVAAMLASIGGQVRTARQARGWFLADLAAQLGLSASVLCRMELARREPSLYQVILTCAALGLRVSDVFRRAEDEAFPLGAGPWERPAWPGLDEC